ncbi:hypothetical protein V2G26_019626 [Clonostachys chloroleuca]
MHAKSFVCFIRSPAAARREPIQLVRSVQSSLPRYHASRLVQLDELGPAFSISTGDVKPKCSLECMPKFSGSFPSPHRVKDVLLSEGVHSKRNVESKLPRH